MMEWDPWLTRNLTEIKPHLKTDDQLKYYMTSTSTDNKTGKTMTTQSIIPVVLEVPDNNDKGLMSKIKKIKIGGVDVDLVQYILSKNIAGLGKVLVMHSMTVLKKVIAVHILFE